jgi:hypothetical protein
MKDMRSSKIDALTAGAEVLKNSVLIGSGQVNGVSSDSSRFNNAVLRTINLALAESVPLNPGDTLSFRLSVRIAVGFTGHRNGTARLWYNDAEANSRVAVALDGLTRDFFLLDGSLWTSPPGRDRRRRLTYS